MCGLAGFYTKASSVSKATLHAIGREMASTLTHRGPDAGDVWQDPDMPVVLAHRRLSILDLSSEGAQPMTSHTGRYVVVYNGEIYNAPALQRDLARAGAVFKGRSDTEVFLCALEYWGLNRTLQKIDGMFAFALWDRTARALHFVRDRLGKKPLYIGWAGQSMVFGSELKSLRAHPDFRAEVNKESLSQYLKTGWISAPSCIYKNVWALKPAHRLSLSLENADMGGRLDALMEPYWNPSDVVEQARSMGGGGHISEKEMVDEFESLLTTCVADRMISDVPLGAFLSGGIDSSAVVALMQTLSSQPVKTYTIGFARRGFDEAVHAKKVAKHLGTDHHELYLDDAQTLDILPRLPDIYDEPFADVSAIPTFLVSHFARKDVTVALSGDGGDEMLGGYNRHIQGPKMLRIIHAISRFVPKNVRSFAAAKLHKIPADFLDHLNPLVPQWGQKMHKCAELLNLDTAEDVYARLLSVWDKSPVLGTVRPSLNLEDFGTLGLSVAERMMLWDTLHYLPYDILTKVDRASMAASLEARAPLLDTRIFAYAWGLPEHMKIRGGQGKYILRAMLARHVPRSLFDRPKQGFSSPVGDWLRGPLRDWAEALLDERNLREQGLLDVPMIRAAWDRHLKGQGNHANGLWAVCMFQSWHRRWMKAL